MVARVIEVSQVADEAEEQLSLELYNAVWPHEALTLAEVHSFKRAVVECLDLVARVNGEPAGSAVVAIFPQRRDLAFLLSTVLPERRRLGAGTRLFEETSRWARGRGLERMEVPVLDDDPESLAFARRRGFVEARHEKGVVLELASVEPPPVEPPEGVEIFTWAERPELARGMYEVAREAFPDIPGLDDDEVEPFEDWLLHEMQGSGDRADATFVAVAGDEVVAYAKFSLTAARPTSAAHDLTGVKRAWRGRGVARALKATQIGWAKANGFEALQTRNDERNAPIRRLNAEFGYRPAIGRIYLQGPPAAT